MPEVHIYISKKAHDRATRTKAKDCACKHRDAGALTVGELERMESKTGRPLRGRDQTVAELAMALKNTADPEEQARLKQRIKELGGTSDFEFTKMRHWIANKLQGGDQGTPAERAAVVWWSAKLNGRSISESTFPASWSAQQVKNFFVRNDRLDPSIEVSRDSKRK